MNDMIDRANIWMHEGNSIASERISGVNDNMTASHYHEFYEIYYLESGERYHLMDEELYKVTAGQFIIFKPYQMHRSYGDENMPFSRLLTYFNEDSIEEVEIKKIMNDMVGVYQFSSDKNAEFYQLLTNLLKEQEERKDFYTLNMKSLLNQILVLLVRSKLQKRDIYSDNRITKIISYIHRNYRNKITTEDLAKEFFISKWHLCREFKNYTNITIIQYINYTRIIEAQKLLLEDTKNITEISSEVGFDSMTHFERVFKQIVGITPTQFKTKKYRKY